MVHYHTIENNSQKGYGLSRVGFFKSQGGHLFAQEISHRYALTHKVEDQKTITLGTNMSEIKALRDFLNSLNLEVE